MGRTLDRRYFRVVIDNCLESNAIGTFLMHLGYQIRRMVGNKDEGVAVCQYFVWIKAQDAEH